MVADLCQRWRLTVDGPAWHGHLAIGVPVHQESEPCVLKISWRDPDTVHEALALTIGNGQGSVRVLAAASDHRALLHERLDAQRTLFDLPLQEAIPVATEMAQLFWTRVADMTPSLVS